MVNYEFLGNSGLRVSNLIFGNWLTHGSQVEEEAATACVHAALDHGITTFDTADVYANGAAEQVLGRALAGENRDNLEIFTKVYWPTGQKRHNDAGLSRKHIMTSIHRSLRNLGTDYVDVYQAHRYDVETPIEETMQAFADVVRAGKALYIGVSEWTAEQIKYAHDFSKELGFQVISSQPQYNMLYRVIESEVIPMSEKCGVSQIVWSPMAQGVLSGKYRIGEELPAGSRATDSKGGARTIQRYLSDEILRAVDELEPIANEMGLTRAQLAVAWVLQNDNVTSAIIGASRPEQIAENVVAADVTIPAELMARIDDVLRDVIIDDPRLTSENAPHERPEILTR
ncbi:aldo/keto reductase family protein [Flaviflexus massiliensis]|uniref:aldo/keto reductase family protein n=1 Tax=Flaviflexus massiliensis TaxID=1522309 RepID=UPI0006D56A89|nr:aldo/keto reductase family protein [Flaviflexus massiliensis]